MKIKYFFELIEKTNEFKNLVGETIKTSITVFYRGNILGTVQSMEHFFMIIGEELENKIKYLDIQKTSSLREFKIVFENDGEKDNIKLFVE